MLRRSLRATADSEHKIETMSWGFVLLQNGKAPRPVTNVHDDTILKSSFWRSSFVERRCLVPAISFCEPNGDLKPATSGAGGPARSHAARSHAARSHAARLHETRLHETRLHEARLHEARLHEARLHEDCAGGALQGGSGRVARNRPQRRWPRRDRLPTVNYDAPHSGEVRWLGQRGAAPRIPLSLWRRPLSPFVTVIKAGR